MNSLVEMSGVRGYAEDGKVFLNLEDVARGLGFTELAQSGNETVRWRTVKGYLDGFGFIATSCDAKTFIPENIFYRLAMKAKNETAEKFQILVADEILPSIRKHGAYMTPETLQSMISSPEFGIKLLTALKEEREKNQQLQLENSQKEQIINELQPKATYYDLVLQSPSVVPISVIAKDFGMSGTKLNKTLHELKVQYKMDDTWLLYQKYAKNGYTQSKTYVLDNGKTEMNTYWTNKGRLFIYELLKSKLGVLPLIEREEN